jgi:hypothetical protein
METSDLPTSGVTPREEGAVVDVNKLVAQYVAIRDRKRLLEQQQKDAMAPFTQVMDEIAGKMLAHMDKLGVDSLAGSGGTVYRTTKQSASIKDGELFKDFVRDNKAWELVDWRANAKAVFDYVRANNGMPPPGVSPSSFTTVGVRRPTDKEE